MQTWYMSSIVQHRRVSYRIWSPPPNRLAYTQDPRFQFEKLSVVICAGTPETQAKVMSISSVPAGKCQDSASVRPWPEPYTSFQLISYPTFQSCIALILNASQNKSHNYFVSKSWTTGCEPPWPSGTPHPHTKKGNCRYLLTRYTKCYKTALTSWDGQCSLTGLRPSYRTDVPWHGRIANHWQETLPGTVAYWEIQV